MFGIFFLNRILLRHDVKTSAVYHNKINNFTDDRKYTKPHSMGKLKCM